MLSDKFITCFLLRLPRRFRAARAPGKATLLHKEHERETVTYAIVSQGMTDLS